MQFKDFFIGTLYPQSNMENGFLGQKGMGEGGCMVTALALQVAACRHMLMSNRLFQYCSPSFLEGEMQEGEITETKKPGVQRSEWIFKLTNLF